MVLALNYRTMATVISKPLLTVYDLKRGTGLVPRERSLWKSHLKNDPAINSFYDFRRGAILSHFLALI
jgi:hypothetical protein